MTEAADTHETPASVALPIFTLSNLAKSGIERDDSCISVILPSPIENSDQGCFPSRQEIRKDIVSKFDPSPLRQQQATIPDNCSACTLAADRGPRPRTNSEDNERVPTWIPAHIPGCQHDWHHHTRKHHPASKTHSPTQKSTQLCQCPVGASAGAEKSAPHHSPCMSWWPDPENVAQHEWTEQNKSEEKDMVLSGFGMDEALSDDDQEALINL